MAITNATDATGSPTIVWRFGGPIAYAYPEGHDSMVMGWCLLSGDVFMQAHGRTRTMFFDVKTAGQFKAHTTQIFDDIFKPDTEAERAS